MPAPSPSVSPEALETIRRWVDRAELDDLHRLARGLPQAASPLLQIVRAEISRRSAVSRRAALDARWGGSA